MAWCRKPKRAPDRCHDSERVDGHVIEISVTGLGIVADTHKTLEAGSVVLLHCLGLTCPVVVRRLDHEVYPGETFYGVELLDATSPLHEALAEQFREAATGPGGDTATTH